MVRRQKQLDYRVKRGKIIVRNVKMLTWLQLVTIAGAILTVSICKNIEPAKGVVTGILYTIEDSTALIDGQILKQGDSLYGVEIIKIERRHVEFQKYSHRWKQYIKDSPNPAWWIKENETSPH